MKLLLSLALMALTTSAYCHFKPNTKGYLVKYHAGEAWNPKAPYKKQKDIGAHIIYLKKVYHKGHINWGASDNKERFSILLLEGKSEKDVRSLLDADPAVKSKLVKYSLSDVTVTMRKKGGHNHQH